MAKGKKASSGGSHKSHGPKKNMFRWAKPMKHSLAKTGVLSKYYDFEAWQQAVQAKGKRNAGQAEFRAFFVLTDEEKKAYFENLSK